MAISYNHFNVIRSIKQLANIKVLKVTLAFSLLLGVGDAIVTQSVAAPARQTVKATARNRAQVKKPKKQGTAKKPATPAKPVSQAKPVEDTNKAVIPPIPGQLFGQQEVDNSKLIAVAAPIGTTAHQLLIFEQVSDKQPCWSEGGISPATVDPLLLNFDFTGICGRSTDSNGYSIRLANEDIGKTYDLRVVKEGDQLLLIGKNFRDPNATPIVIGRSDGIGDKFTKLNLDRGWRFSKRTYNGKTLGHIYLTNDYPLTASSSVQP